MVFIFCCTCAMLQRFAKKQRKYFKFNTIFFLPIMFDNLQFVACFTISSFGIAAYSPRPYRCLTGPSFIGWRSRINKSLLFGCCPMSGPRQTFHSLMSLVERLVTKVRTMLDASRSSTFT